MKTLTIIIRLNYFINQLRKALNQKENKIPRN